MQLVIPGSGPNQCLATTNRGERCGNKEIDGLEYCLHHMPDEYLDEAEQITGWHRCRERFGQPDACRYFAVKGTDPPACKNHGANRGAVKAKQAATNVLQGKVQDRLTAIMGEQGDRLLNPPAIGNPLSELLDLAAEIAEWKNIMRDIVMYLTSRDRIRSAHSKVGEQLRAEVLLFERAQERYAKILIDITKLGIEARLAQIEQQQVDMVDRALSAALAASGLSLLEQDKARGVLRRELVKVAKAG
jgi:hypothetical protein